MSGVFIVAPDERGIVLRFERVVREADPGPRCHLPWPVERVLKPSVTQIRKQEFGFRTIAVGSPARYRHVDPEALMLNGDGNIVKLQFIVQYKVKPEASGATDFLFKVQDSTGAAQRCGSRQPDPLEIPAAEPRADWLTGPRWVVGPAPPRSPPTRAHLPPAAGTASIVPHGVAGPQQVFGADRQKAWLMIWGGSVPVAHRFVTVHRPTLPAAAARQLDNTPRSPARGVRARGPRAGGLSGRLFGE